MRVMVVILATALLASSACERRDATVVNVLVVDSTKAQSAGSHFELYKDAKGEWRWRLYATNQRIVADSSEGYKNRQDAIAGIELLKQATFRLYKDAKREWRWRALARNNKIIADSGEGYKNRQDAIDGIRLTVAAAMRPTTEDRETPAESRGPVKP